MTASTALLHQQSDTTASERVLAAVAAQEGVDPLDLDRPLYDAIDPDALDALFQPPQMDGHVTFTYRGYEVTVQRDGGIEATPVDG